MIWYKRYWWIPASLFLMVGLPMLMQTQRIHQYGRRADYTIQPFKRHNPAAKLKVLFLGDSTVVGTGTSVNTQSTAGWFARDFPHAHIDNVSKNGARLQNVLRNFHPGRMHYNLAVIQIGGNDIMHLTPFSEIKSQIAELIDRVDPVADTIVILHSGNVGLAPIFCWPFTEILGRRSAMMREVYRQTANEHGALYVDLWADRSQDLFLTDIGRYYSADLLHPSGAGYHWWYTRIRQTLNDAGIGISGR